MDALGASRELTVLEEGTCLFSTWDTQSFPCLQKTLALRTPLEREHFIPSVDKCRKMPFGLAQGVLAGSLFIGDFYK